MKMKSVLAASIAVMLLSAPEWAAAGDFVVMDQIGPGPGSLAFAASSSMFHPDTPTVGGVTIDNFSITDAPVHVTSVEAVVAALMDFSSYDLVESWTVQIYSSPDVAVQTIIGDVYSASFDRPADLTTGYDALYESELALFDVGVVLDPGDYWIGVAMGNDADLNGIVGIRGSLIGDGPAKIAVSTSQQIADLSHPAAYRITGTVIPAPGACVALSALLIARRRRRVG